jgi:hypothetical protein
MSVANSNNNGSSTVATNSFAASQSATAASGNQEKNTGPNVVLGVRHIFGVNSNVIDNLTFTDDDSIVYVAGHGIVVYSFSERRQRFLHSTEITDMITCYTSGPGKRLCAIAEKGDGPLVHVFDLRTFRRKKSLSIPDIQSKV